MLSANFTFKEYIILVLLLHGLTLFCIHILSSSMSLFHYLIWFTARLWATKVWPVTYLGAIQWNYTRSRRHRCLRWRGAKRDNPSSSRYIQTSPSTTPWLADLYTTYGHNIL